MKNYYVEQPSGNLTLTSLPGMQHPSVVVVQIEQSAIEPYEPPKPAPVFKRGDRVLYNLGGNAGVHLVLGFDPDEDRYLVSFGYVPYQVERYDPQAFEAMYRHA